MTYIIIKLIACCLLYTLHTGPCLAYWFADNVFGLCWKSDELSAIQGCLSQAFEEQKLVLTTIMTKGLIGRMSSLESGAEMSPEFVWSLESVLIWFNYCVSMQGQAQKPCCPDWCFTRLALQRAKRILTWRIPRSKCSLRDRISADKNTRPAEEGAKLIPPESIIKNDITGYFCWKGGLQILFSTYHRWKDNPCHPQPEQWQREFYGDGSE